MLLSEKLKQQTLASHQQLEKCLMNHMRFMRNLHDYVQLLQLFYSYFGALEHQVNKYITNAELPDHAQRRKTTALIKDIRSLGNIPAALVTGNELPVIGNSLQAFGVLYVIEGSTLGGNIITQILKKQLGIADESLFFFKSYGDQLNTMWDEFKKTLNQFAKNEDEEHQVIIAAEATFIKFRALLENREAV